MTPLATNRPQRPNSRGLLRGEEFGQRDPETVGDPGECLQGRVHAARFYFRQMGTVEVRATHHVFLGQVTITTELLDPKTEQAPHLTILRGILTTTRRHSPEP